MEAVETFGERLRRYRTARGLSQAALARSCMRFVPRMSRYDIQRYEDDYQEPRMRNFAALASSLDVSMEALFYGGYGATTAGGSE